MPSDNFFFYLTSAYLEVTNIWAGILTMNPWTKLFWKCYDVLHLKKKILSSIEKEKYKPRHAKGIVCTVSRSETNFIVIFVELTDIIGLW